MSRYDLSTIGEACIRHATRPGERLSHASWLEVGVAGSEANVAAALAHLGWKTAWVSRLPEGALARRISRYYAEAGVDLSGLDVVSDGRVGTLYIERHPPPRATRVTFDRRASAFTTMDVADVPWDVLLNSRLVHLTGITTPLSESVARTIRAVAERACGEAVPYSYDVNYRRHLWPPEACRDTTRALVRNAEVVFCSHRDAQLLLDAPKDPERALDCLQDATSARCIVMSRGHEGASARVDGVSLHHPSTPTSVVDRAGAGDALAAGFLHAYLDGVPERGLAYGALMARMALGQFDEVVLTSREELDAILDGESEANGGIDR